MATEIREADLTSAADAAALLAVLDSYAQDEMGGAVPLTPDVRQRLIPALIQQPNALVLLALQAGDVVGIAICFFGFSTFAARPLLNVHDLAVLPRCRGRGVGRALLSAAEARALERGCAKLTLEVREDNARARGLYASCGFRDFELAGASYRTLFLAKPLVRGRDDVLVRQATLADTERALVVVRRSITESCTADHRNDPAVLERWLANKTPEHFAGWLADQDSVVIVAEARGVVRGVGKVNRNGHIHLCYVEPGYQGLGLGAAIVRELERLARGWSLHSLALESSADARPFYERMGYVAAGAPQCARGGVSCFPYAKNLS